MRGPYESAWFARDVRYRKDLYILIGQLNKNVVFSAGPFSKLTVATFINVSYWLCKTLQKYLHVYILPLFSIRTEARIQSGRRMGKATSLNLWKWFVAVLQDNALMK